MSYRRTAIFLLVLVLLAAFYYVYEVKGGKARTEAERAEKLLFSFKADEVTALTLKRPSETIILKKSGNEWNVNEPVNTPADQNAVSQIIDALAGLEYERDIGAQKDLQQFGLSDAAMEVEIEGETENLGRLSLGKSTPDGSKVYAKPSKKEHVFTISALDKSKIEKTLFDIRNKKVLEFSDSDIKALTITRDGQKLALEKDLENTWIIASQNRHLIDETRIDGLLDSLRFSYVKKFVEEEASNLGQYGLDDPTAGVELAMPGETKTLSFGDKPEAESDRVYARQNGGNRIVELGTEVFDKLVADAGDWRDRRFLKFDRSDVVRLQIDSDSGRTIIERSNEERDEWKMIEPEPAIADEGEIRNLLLDIDTARIARFLDEDEMSMAESLIDKPLAELRLWKKGDEQPIVLVVSKSADKPEIYVKTDQSEEIFAAEEKIMNLSTVKPDALRDRSALRFEGADVEKIEITRGDSSYIIKRKDVQWKAPRDLEMTSYEVDQFLWELRRLRYKTIGPMKEDAEYYGVDPPALDIGLWMTGEEEPLRLQIGRRVAEKNTYYAHQSIDGDTSNLIMEIDGTQIDEWLGKF